MQELEKQHHSKVVREIGPSFIVASVQNKIIVERLNSTTESLSRCYILAFSFHEIVKMRHSEFMKIDHAPAD